jgi:amino acid adenylation domain-containing protein
VIPEQNLLGRAVAGGGLSAEARALLDRRARASQGAISGSPTSVRSSAGEPAPLSSWQRNIWFFEQMAPGKDLYNRPLRLRLRGRLDVPALEQALCDMFRRHEVLRSRMSAIDGDPAQCLVPDFTFTLPVITIDGVDAAEREARYVEIADAEAREPFDLTAGPFARAVLIRVDDEEHVLLFTAHHIVFDGWSGGAFFRELGETYSALANGWRPSLEALQFQFADFAVAQRERVASGSLENDLAYWLAEMAGAPALLELPTDRPRSSTGSRAAGRASTVLPSDVVDGLRALGRSERCTLFMTTLAAFQLLASRLACQDDVVVGVAIAGRTDAKTEAMLGCFMNVLPLRARVVSGASFRELLRGVRRTTLGAFAHQDLPFDVLVERIQPERSLGHTPVTQVLFNFRNTPAAPVSLYGLHAVVENPTPTSLVSDFELSLDEGPEGLSCVALYSADLFDATTVERWLGHFRTLLEGIVASPDERVERLPLLSSSERRMMLVDWNADVTPPDYEHCVHELIEAQVRMMPAAIAVVAGENVLTYAELNRRANWLARDLVVRGVGPDVLVGICMERCVELSIALLAVMKAGGAYVPMDPGYPPDRLRYMLEDASPAVVLTQRDAIERLGPVPVPSILVDAEYWAGSSARDEGDLPRRGSPDSLAYVIYTSGSTGRPKGAMNTHRGVCNFLLWFRDNFGVGDADVVLHRTPFSFDASVPELFAAHITGARVVHARPDGHADPDYLAGLIAEQGITLVCVVPSLLQVLLETSDVSRLWQTVRAVSCGGEAMSLALQERFLSTLTCRLLNTYGPSETAVYSSSWECERQSTRHAVPIGRPLANTQSYILDAGGEPVPIGVTGELHVGGVGVGRGYLNRPELTAERFIADPFSGKAGARMYRSGDLARFGAGGVIEYLGRMDDQIKIRGVRIELGEIEAALIAVSGVRDCAVIAREDKSGDKRIVAYIVPSSGADEALSDRVLRERLKQTLLPQMIPSAFVKIHALPLSPNGKVDRKKLPAPESRTTSVADRVLPGTPTEVLVATAWAVVFKGATIGIHDDFFEMGGHSLHATRVMARIRDLSGVDVSVKHLFECPTIESLARALDDITLASHSDAEVARILAEILATSPDVDDEVT